MSRYFIQPLDPVELSSRFSTEQSLEPLTEIDDEWKETRLEEIKDVLDYLPDVEADYIRLYYFRDKKQVDIAEIFDVTQAAVSYRIKRGKERLKFILDMPDLSKDEVYEILKDEMNNEKDPKIFREMYATSCQTEVADRLDLGQGCVRHRFLNNLRHLGKKLIDKLNSWLSKNDQKTRPSEVDLVDTKLSQFTSQMDDLEDKEFEDRLFEIISILETIHEDEEKDVYTDSVMEFASIYRVFVRIRYNFNILREVELPKWTDDFSKKVY